MTYTCTGMGPEGRWQHVQNLKGTFERNLLVLLVAKRPTVGLGRRRQIHSRLGHGHLFAGPDADWPSSQRQRLRILARWGHFGFLFLGHSSHPLGPLYRSFFFTTATWCVPATLKSNNGVELTGDELRALCHQYPPPRPIFASGANGSWVRGVAYARSGCQTATIADDGLIRFWNLLDPPEADPSAIAIGDGNEEMVCCTFSPSGRVFAVG